MSERTGTKTGEKPATSGAEDTTEPRGQTRPAVFASLKSPRIKASASEMAEFLESYAHQLLHVAEQLRTKEKGGTITVPWPPHGIIMDCNGGSDGP